MLRQKSELSIETHFLNSFTEEIILVLAEQRKIRANIGAERQNIRQEVEVLKLKNRFLTPIKPFQNYIVRRPLININQNSNQNSQLKIVRQEIQSNEPFQKSIIHQNNEEVREKTLEQNPEQIQKEVKLKSIQKQFQQPIQNQQQRRQNPSQKPIQTTWDGIDFGMMINFIRDNSVSYIECPGESKEVIIRRQGNIIKTSISLNKEEIITLIKSFSLRARIPLVEGMLIARNNNIEISAVVSETISPSFIIRKIF